MNPALLNAFGPSNPIRKLYQKAIDTAQNGKPDNDYKQFRYYVLHQLLQYALHRFPFSDVVECGCWHGHSTILTAELMREMKVNAHLHVFDSFKGLSEFKAEDMSAWQATKKLRDAERVHYASDFKRLSKLTAPYGFVDLHKGWIPAVFDGVKIEEIGFATIDVDLYEPTRDALAFIYPKLMPGAVVFFDDYGYNCFPGAKKAVDEYLSTAFPPAMFIENPMGSAYLVR